MGWLISWVGKSLKRQANSAQEELGNLFSLVDETLKSSKVIKIFNADKILKKRFDTTTTLWQKYAIGMSRRRELASPMSEFWGLSRCYLSLGFRASVLSTGLITTQLLSLFSWGFSIKSLRLPNNYLTPYRLYKAEWQVWREFRKF